MAFPKEAFLTHNWQMGEASGTRADLVGGMTLTDNNTVGSAAGLVYPLAANLIAANSEYLSHADDASLRIVGATTFEVWARWTSGTNAPLFCKRGATNEYESGYYSGYGGMYLDVLSGGSLSSARSPLVPVSGTWYHLVMWYDPADRKARIAVNGGAVAAGAALPGAPNVSAAAFAICRDLAAYWNGDIGPARMWNTLLDAADRTALYNGGAGLAYPSTSTPTLSIYGAKFGHKQVAHGGGMRYGDAS